MVNYICPTCKGVGKITPIPGNNFTKTCHFCHGYGTIRTKCNRCHEEDVQYISKGGTFFCKNCKIGEVTIIHQND